ncbi:hypothetical protein CUZ93_0845 [Enterococcus xinjiangensis]|nr:hypothetical protein [Enterococcus lactis]
MFGCSYYLMQGSFFTTSDTRCSISCPSVLAQKTAKYEELFFRLFL